jgi:hypothetical protein
MIEVVVLLARKNKTKPRNGTKILASFDFFSRLRLYYSNPIIDTSYQLISLLTMNIHTFKDATTDRRSALANELADDGELGASVLVYEMRFR